MLAFLVGAVLPVIATPAWAPPGRSALPVSAAQEVDTELSQLVAQLGDARYERREEATRRLILLGPRIADPLNKLARRQKDLEVLHRIRHVLESVTPPAQAALLIRVRAGCGLRSGDVVTHANGWRIRGLEELRRILADAPSGTVVRVLGADGPRDVPAISNHDVMEVLDYVAPQGEIAMQVVRRYAEGYVEEACELLRSLDQPLPERELTHRLRARILYTAGESAAARQLLASDGEAVRSDGSGDLWTAPSELDMAGPGKAPFHLERILFEASDYISAPVDPDLRVQRVLVPAGRYVDAAVRCAELWWRHYRDAPADADRSVTAGNMLAVTAWMCAELDLQSECCRLIGPRSRLLRHTWIRVQTAAWLDFLAGEPAQALDGFFESARDVLVRLPRAHEGDSRTRNPRVAAMVAFFLYQFPEDRRVEELLGSVNAPGHPGLTSYLDWMLYALRAENETLIRRHLAAALPTLSDAEVAPYARALALLEYVVERPNRDVFVETRLRIEQSSHADRARMLAEIDALAALAGGAPAQAAVAVDALGDSPGAALLRSTIEFVQSPPPGGPGRTALERPLLATPLNRPGEWLVLGRDRRLLVYSAATGALDAISPPSASWFPAPALWPWIGREPGSGRAWVYDRRRVVELTPRQPAPLRLNLRTADIPAFDRHVAAHFSLLGQMVNGEPPPGEEGDFLRAELVANTEYAVDPDLPEIGCIEPVPGAGDVVNVTLRGGPQLLIHQPSGRVFTAPWLAAAAGLARPPRFFPQARPGGHDAGAPVLMLMSDQGLLRLDVDAERVSRIAMPGEEPYPALTPERAPYERRDPRFVYVARVPEEGGQVFRYVVASGEVEALAMVNEALPARYYDVQSRSALRAMIDRRLLAIGVLPLQEFIEDANQIVSHWKEGAEPP